MAEEDPFGLNIDAGRTRIRPASKPRVSKGSQHGHTPGNVATAPARLRDTRAHNNPLINAFSVLLGLAPELAVAQAPENPDVLRTRLLDNLTHARDAAVSSGVQLSQADKAAWFVAALLDDVALNTPWGGQSGWPRMPLVAELYGNVDAGERFFDLADDLLAYPDRDPGLAEIVFVCLSMGFRGKHRIAGQGGTAELTRLRSQLARNLGNRVDPDQPLSPHWRGVVADDEPRRFIIPLWAIGMVALGLVTAIYVGLSIRLSNKGEQLYTLAAVLPPPERARIFRPIVETVKEPAPVPEPLILELLPLFAQNAPPATISALTGREDVSLTVVVVQSTSTELFRSSKAEINSEYESLVASIAGVITENIDVIGQLQIIGHTDSVPVQRSNPFQSNQGLSEARARAFADRLVKAGVPAGLITAQGRAASEPIADNTTREGRARNRRIEIIVQKRV